MVVVTVLALFSRASLMGRVACPRVYTLFYTHDTKGALNALKDGREK
jgi:hypothetical protein